MQKTIPTFCVFLALATCGIAADPPKKEITESELLAKLGEPERAYVAVRLIGDPFPTAPYQIQVGSLRSGQVVRLGGTWNVSQVLDKQNMLINGSTVWVEGVNTDDVIDDSGISFTNFTFYVQGTKSYESVRGSQRTVKHVVAVNSVIADQVVEVVKKMRSFRTWQDTTGKFEVVAAFVKFEDNKVYLQRKDSGKEVSVAMNSLRKEDQTWIRDELKRRKEESKPSAKKKAKRR